MVPAQLSNATNIGDLAKLSIDTLKPKERQMALKTVGDAFAPL